MPMLRLFRSAVHTDRAGHAVNHFPRNAFARKRMRPLACAIQAALLGMRDDAIARTTCRQCNRPRQADANAGTHYRQPAQQ